MPEPFDVTLAADTTVRAQLYPATPDPGGRATLILAPGAGAPQTSPFMTQCAEGLAARGIDVVTFNFLYMERRRRAPDPAPRLEQCYRAAIEATRDRVPSAADALLIGGKSMGGRIASQVAAADEADCGVAGLVFLGYPLHPPGRPDKRRDAHLPRIAAPMLFVQGSRDTFGTRDELEPVVDACPRARLYVVEGGDHSLKVRKKDGRPQDQVYAAVMDEVARFALAPDS